jgi:hypothetical protein
MAKALNFYGGSGFNDDLIIEDIMQQAAAEIFATYGHITKNNRKSLRKYGRNEAVGTGEFDITPFTVGAYTTETNLVTNGIDSLSSSDSADTNVSIYLEGFTINAVGELSFVSQVVNTDASDGQTRVPLVTPLCNCSRARGVTAGNVWIYENTALTAGKPTDVTKIHNQLVQADRTSLKAGTAIARNNYFVLLGQWATVGKASGSAAADIRFKQSTINDPVLGNEFFTRVVWSIGLGSPAAGPGIEYAIVPPNTRLTMTGSASSGTLDVKAGFYGKFLDIVAYRDPTTGVVTTFQ